jgi:hypothetical protein
MLYGACAKIAKTMGYKRLITYTLHDESGASLKAVGWKLIDNQAGGKTWEKHTIHPGHETDLFGQRKMPMGPI